MQQHWALKEAPANGLRGCEACFAEGQLHHSPLPLISGCMRIHRAWKQPGTTQKQTPAEGRHARKVSETSSSALSQAPALDRRQWELRADLGQGLGHTCR